jgi:O-antigen ligase
VRGYGRVFVDYDTYTSLRKVSVAAKGLLFAVLAFVTGLGAAYAPVMTFIVVAAAASLALWRFSSEQGWSKTRASRGLQQRSRPSGTLATKLVSGYLLVWWLLLTAPLATYAPRSVTGAEVSAAAATGSLRNQLLVVSFGLVGSLFLPAAIRRFDPRFRWVVLLWVLYLCWAFASLLWSVFPPLTFRNACAMVLVSVGSFGLGAGFYGGLANGRDLLLRHIFFAGVVSALVILIPLPLHWQQYDLLNPSQRVRIGDNVSMTTFAVRPLMCALLALVATQILRVRQWRSRDWLWVALLVLPLLALKSRGPIVWGMLALVIFYLSYKTLLRDRILQAGLLVLIGLGTYLSRSESAFAWLSPFLTRGSAQYTSTLTGRLPLWDILIPEIAQHPWLGVGFAAFWNPSNVYKIEQLAGETWVSAHNGFLEELLNTGVVGLAILLAFHFYAMVVVVRQARQGDLLGWLAFLFLLNYLLLNLTNALIQEYLEIPSIIVLTILGLMCSKQTADTPTPPPQASSVGQKLMNSLR